MNKLPIAKQAQILHLLCEGSSMRAITRIVDCSINTVTKLLVDVGTACYDYQDDTLRNLPCQRVQLDEIWAFCFSKAKNVPEDKRGQVGYGDVWTWTALCADTKLLISWLVGGRDGDYARAFVQDLAGRLAYRVQVTSDGHSAYLEAVDVGFASEVDYAQLVKLYGNAPQIEQKYSPAECIATRREVIVGNPDPRHISTSYVERANLTMRMSMRRFTRLTNAHSKKLENHEHAVALFAMYYNFVRIHQSLRVTPAMQAGLTDHVWTFEEIAGLVGRLPKD